MFSTHARQVYLVLKCVYLYKLGTTEYLYEASHLHQQTTGETTQTTGETERAQKSAPLYH